MKKVILLMILAAAVRTVFGQFVDMPLNYPNDGTAHMSWWTSIVDADHLWVGTVRQGPVGGYMAYSVAVKTTDGGNTWQFDSIPVPGNPWIQHLAAWDANICYYLFTDGNTGGGSVWKTTDAGTTWTKKTTTQFAGGWANIIHAFSADTILAIGDPNGGYFEIQISNDGGNTWARVPASDMPAAISGEWGVSADYCAVGNSVWFGTSKGNCYRSSDRGLHWAASIVVPEYMTFCFTDEMNGIGWRPGTSKGFYKSADGGATWTPKTTVTNYVYGGMCRVPGINGGYIATAWDSTAVMADGIDVFFTPDAFSTVQLIDSAVTNASGPNFKSPSIGWLGGSYNYYHNIHKFTGVISSTDEKTGDNEPPMIFPNPAHGFVHIILPAGHGNSSVSLFNLTGQRVFYKPDITGPEFTIPLSGLARGMYLVVTENLKTVDKTKITIY